MAPLGIALPELDPIRDDGVRDPIVGDQTVIA